MSLLGACLRLVLYQRSVEQRGIKKGASVMLRRHVTVRLICEMTTTKKTNSVA
jgi:hypothetical protein